MNCSLFVCVCLLVLFVRCCFLWGGGVFFFWYVCVCVWFFVLFVCCCFGVVFVYFVAYIFLKIYATKPYQQFLKKPSSKTFLRQGRDYFHDLPPVDLSTGDSHTVEVIGIHMTTDTSNPCKQVFTKGEHTLPHRLHQPSVLLSQLYVASIKTDEKCTNISPVK